MCVGKLKEKIVEEKKCVEKCQKLGSSTAVLGKIKREFEKYNFLAWYEDFIRPRVSKDNLVSSIETEGDQSFDDDDDYEDIGFNMGEHHAVEPKVEELNVNPSKKTKQKQLKSKKNVKNSKDLEENEIIQGRRMKYERGSRKHESKGRYGRS